MSNNKARTALDEQSNEGEFKRRDAAWRNCISREEGANHPPEVGRYHLYVAYACPWAHRTLMTRALKGLEGTISITVVHPIWQKTKPNDPADSHTGWVFGKPDGAPFVNTAGKGGPFPAGFPSNGEFILVFCFAFSFAINLAVFLPVDFFCVPYFLRS
jgi:putative glutathione S-transferase